MAGPVPPGYGHYGPPGGRQSGSNGPAIGALVANIVAAILCCASLAWIPGVILASVAMNRINTDPDSARRLTMWAWVCFAIDAVLMAAFFVIVFALGAYDDFGGTSSP